MHYDTIATNSDEEFARRGCEAIATAVRAALTAKRRCVIGLSGGGTPRNIYALLAQTPGIDWSQVWLFLVDERLVPADDQRSNQMLVRETLLANAPIPAAQCVFPDTGKEPEAAVRDYEARLRPLVEGGIDIVILGMGEDGHIASLFPPVSPLANGEALVLHTLATGVSPDQPPPAGVRHRITVTLPVLRDAQSMFFLLQGQGKKRVWEAMLQSTDDWHRWPAKPVLGTDRATIVTYGF